MAVEMKKSARKQIFNILLVLTLGILFAFIISLSTLYYFGPTGSYKAGNLLLSPEVSSTLSYYDQNPSGTKPRHFVFDRIEFQYFDSKERQWRRERINLEQYKHFFDTISDERSLMVVPETLSLQFENESPAVLTVMVKNESPGGGASTETRAFQEMEFLKGGDYYRIQIHDAREGQHWAYFYHAGIYQEALKILKGRGQGE